MAKIDHPARTSGPSDDETPRLWRRCLDHLRGWLQDWIAGPDEKWAAERGYETWRSPSGWSVSVRDPRFNLRHECGECDGTGRDRISGAECAECGGVGVVTDPEQGEQA